MASRPVILIVDDDPVDLRALRDALDRRYHSDYRVEAPEVAGAASVST